MKGSMVGEEALEILSGPENFGVKLGSSTEFLDLDSPTTAGIAKVQRCSEDNAICQATSPNRRTPSYANKILVELPASISIVASNYESANPSFMNLAVSGLGSQEEVGGLLGTGDHSAVAGEPDCQHAAQRVSMLQRQAGSTVGH